MTAKKNAKKGAEMEEAIRQEFTEAGWECTNSNKAKQMDITLAKGGKEIGYVDCYCGALSKQLVQRKIAGTKHFLEEVKPPLFVLTNGDFYEMYIFGKYAGIMHTAITYELFCKMGGLG